MFLQGEWLWFGLVKQAKWSLLYITYISNFIFATIRSYTDVFKNNSCLQQSTINVSTKLYVPNWAFSNPEHENCLIAI